eukprot:6348922-Prymnesium_polylepis.1
MGRSRAMLAKSTSSCSFTPAISTQLTLSGVYPSSIARSIAERTRERPSRRVRRAKRARSSVSSERLSRSSPAAPRAPNAPRLDDG